MPTEEPSTISPSALRIPNSAFETPARDTLTRRLTVGAFWSLSGSLIARGLGLLSAIAVGRILGKAGYGELGLVQSTVGMFGTLAGFGLGLTANKHVAEHKRTDPARAGRILGLAWWTAWLTSGVMSVALWVAAPWLASHTLGSAALGPVLRVGSVLLFLSGINGAQTGALAGFEAFKGLARINLATGCLSFPVMLFAAWRWGLSGAVWGLVCTQLAGCLLCHGQVRREAARLGIRITRSGAWAESGLLWRFSAPAVFTGLVTGAAHWGASALVANQAGGYGDLGLYQAALRVKLVPEMVAGFLMAPLLPVLSEAWKSRDRAAFERSLRFGFVVSGLVILPVALVLAAAPRLAFLPFGFAAGESGAAAAAGAASGSGTGLVQWLMAQSAAYALLYPMSAVLVSMGEMWLSWRVNVFYGLLLWAGSWLLTPSHGATGYAAANAIAFIAANVPCVLFLYRQAGPVMRGVRWGPIAAAATALFLLCVLASGFLSVSAHSR